MKLTTTPKCPKYFKINKSNCKCTLKKNYLEKFINQSNKKIKKTKKAKTPKQRMPNININPRYVNKKCPSGMYYNTEFQMCELNVLNPKQLKKTKKKERKEKKN